MQKRMEKLLKDAGDAEALRTERDQLSKENKFMKKFKI